jgi:hypothetical protein
MKALSVCQPWAWAIVAGLKTVENRSRPTSHRGPLVIHASRSRRYLADDYASLLPGLPPVEQLDFGALVGVVEVVGCVPLAEVEGDPFASGPWCWLLAGARQIRPAPFKGQVGFFAVPESLVVPLGHHRGLEQPDAVGARAPGREPAHPPSHLASRQRGTIDRAAEERS